MKKLFFATTLLILCNSCEKSKIGKADYLVKIEILGTPVIDPYYGSYYDDIGINKNIYTSIASEKMYTSTTYQYSFRDKKRINIDVKVATTDPTTLTHIMLYRNEVLIKESTNGSYNVLSWVNE